jgi:glycosyltransferase involved in cell wall biosynthesis
MKKITLIIAALNEGKEVLNTLKSIFATADEELFDVILFDDGSDKWVDIPKKYYKTFIQHDQRKGIQYCRDLGVSMSETPYVCLLNAHMRFTPGWLDKAITYLDANPKCLLGPTSVVIYSKDELKENEKLLKTLKGEDLERCQKVWDEFNEKIKDIGDPEEIDEKKERKYGATIILWANKEKYLLGPRWITEPQPGNLYEVPEALGAAYFTSKKWYNYIGGLDALSDHGMGSYGNDEELLSLKTWAFGGRVLLMKDVEVGNLYHPLFKRYPDNVEDFVWNKMFILFTLLPWNEAYGWMLKLDQTEWAKYSGVIKNRLIKFTDYLKSIRRRNELNTVRDIKHLLTIKY